MNWIQRAQLTLQLESQAIEGIMALLDASFESIGELILNLKGRVIITGIGKSAIIAQKIVATFNSTGTPAVFMHAADAIHGDLGLCKSRMLCFAFRKAGIRRRSRRLRP